MLTASRNDERNTMQVTVINNDGTQIQPVFDPEHYADVKSFYEGLLNSGQIWQYSIAK